MNVIYHLRTSLILFLLLANWGAAHAQEFPVQVTPVLPAPYSLYLSDYASPESNFQLIIQLRELDRPEYKVKLRMSIEGQGVTISTRPAYAPPAIVLQGGVTEMLSGADLKNYFNPDNLDFVGISKQDFIKKGALPEGFYTFRFEVIDYVRNVVVSNTGFANAWIILNDPPIINLPFNTEKVLATDPQNVTFSWTPRHTASPNAAFTTEYEFTMVELYPDTRNPNDAIRVSRPIFVTETSSTSLNYGITETLLIPGRKYAFRVKAFDTEGRDLFKNNGYSEVFVFQFGDACIPPATIKAEALDEARIKLTWEASDLHTGYGIQYRKKGSSTWNDQNLFTNSAIIPGLQASTTYEYKVKGVCGTIQGEYSVLSTVATLEGNPNEFACGTPAPAIEIKTTPLQNDLEIDDLIKTADFEITVEAVTKNPDGSYKGTGIAFLPWFNFATVKVKFNDIKINEDYRVYSGDVVTIYSKSSKFIANVDLHDEEKDKEGGEGESGAGGDNFVAPDTVTLPVDVKEIIVDLGTNPDVILVVAVDGTTQEIPREKSEDGKSYEDTVVKDSNGDTWIVGKDGKVSEGPSTGAPDALTTLDEVDYIVKFGPVAEQEYGFDAKDSPLGTYEKATIRDKDYDVFWKSVETGRQDRVAAIADGEDPFPGAVGFKINGAEAPSQASSNASQKNVFITGKSAGTEESLSAYVTVKESDDEEAQQVELGKLNIKTYDKIRKKVVIVPVNQDSPIDAASLQSELNNIYKSAVVEWDVEIAPKFEYEPNDLVGLDAEESDIFSSFPEKMQIFNRTFANTTWADAGSYYLFLVKGSGSNRSGFMPFKRKYGYIFNDKPGDIKITIAHELAHGAFRLRHTFSPEAFLAAEKTTNNLMDYKGGKELKKFQWDFVHDPEAVNGWLEDDDESGFGPYEFLVDRNVVPGPFTQHVGDAGSSLSFVTSAGKILTIPNDAYDIAFFNTGVLCAFTINKDGKAVRYVSAEYTASKKFAGFRTNFESVQNDNIYKDKISKSLTSPAKIYLGIPDAVVSGQPNDCGVKLYTSNLVFQVYDDWHSGGNKDVQVTATDIKGKLSTNGGDVSNPVFGSKIAFKVRVANPEACSICEGGKKFINAYGYTGTSEAEYQALLRTAEKICLFPDDQLKNAFSADNDYKFKEKLDQWFLWPSDAARLKTARETFWERPDAWQVYYKQLNVFFDAYTKFKGQMESGALPNHTLKAIVNAHTPEFLSLYNIDDRIGIIRNLLPDADKITTPNGHVNYAELYVSDSEEHAIVTVLKSIVTTADAEKLITEISKDGFLTDLNFHLDDVGLGGDNYTELSKQFQRLALLKKGIQGQVTLQNWSTLVPEANHFVYNDTRTFAFSVQSEEGGVYYETVEYDASAKMNIQYKVCEETKTEIKDRTNSAGDILSTYEVTTCIKTKDYSATPAYFDLITIDIIKTLEFLPQTVSENCGTGVITYAGFLDYVLEKKGTSQVEIVADYTLTTASLVLGVGEVALLIRGGASAGRIALASFDLGTEVADAVVNSTAFAEFICGPGVKDCEQLKTIKLGNTLAQITAIGASGFDIAKNWNSIKAADNIDDALQASLRQIKSSVKAKYAGNAKYTLAWSDHDLTSFIEFGKSLNLTDGDIEAFVLAHCRRHWEASLDEMKKVMQSIISKNASNSIGFKPGYDLLKAYKEAQISMAKGVELSPNVYLTDTYINSHLSKFKGKASYFVNSDAYTRRILDKPSVGIPDDNSLYISTFAKGDEIQSQAGKDLAAYEEMLGLKNGHFSKDKEVWRIDIKNPENFSLRMPSGNEIGANHFWHPGGFTSGGVIEAVVGVVSKNLNGVKHVTEHRIVP